MRIADVSISPVRRPVRRMVRAASHAQFSDYTLGAEPREETVVILEPSQQAPRYAAGYVTQFIHQEIMQDGVHVTDAARAAKLYREANQNAPLPGHTKIYA